ncbi:MAG TPA: hypothetical protein ENK05_02500 [Gammaproteobacteria bacterium]|nr:hypothetical protein [Gammaproteobacteria bacterium]
MKTLIALFTALVLSITTARADGIHTVQLKHRPADEVVPVIQPMLRPGDSISGRGFQLFIRTDEATFRQVEAMIASLDRPAKMLLISVFQGNERDLRALGVAGQVKVDTGKADISIGNTANGRRGGSMELSTRNASAGASTLSTRGRLADNPIHQLRVSDGTEGYIETGESLPYFSGAYWPGARGAVVGGIDYKDVTTGFYVLPRLHGDQVTFDVSPHKQARSQARGGDIKIQSASTRVTGRLGQWLPIGGTTEQIRSKNADVGSRISTQGRNNEMIWIRADLVD